MDSDSDWENAEWKARISSEFMVRVSTASFSNITPMPRSRRARMVRRTSTLLRPNLETDLHRIRSMRPFPAGPEHPLEVLPVFHAGAGDPLIGVNAGKLPL